MMAEAAGTISLATFERTCSLEQIDSLGLDAVEQRYMQLLFEAGGCLRVNVIASCLGLPRPTLERAIEPYLIRSQLIEKSDAGRNLTAAGRQHLMQNAVGRDFETSTPQTDTDQGDAPYP
jgi:Holliday junction DNA helicase RuvB